MIRRCPGPGGCTRPFSADFVLIVCTPTYSARAVGDEAPGRGLGGQWESALIVQEIYEQGAADSMRFIPVLMGEESVDAVPYFLRGTTHYRVPVVTREAIEPLLRRVFRQPEVEALPLGSPPVFLQAEMVTTPTASDDGTPFSKAVTDLVDAIDLVQAGGSTAAYMAKVRTALEHFAARQVDPANPWRASLRQIYAGDSAGSDGGVDTTMVQVVASSAGPPGEGPEWTGPAPLFQSEQFTSAAVNRVPYISNALSSASGYRNPNRSRVEFDPGSAGVWPISEVDASGHSMLYGFLVLDSSQDQAFGPAVVSEGTALAGLFARFFAALLTRKLGDQT